MARRAKLMEMQKDGVIIVPSQVKARSGALTDNLNFLYLTGFKEPDATLVLDPAGSPRETLFRRAASGPGARGAAGGGMVIAGGSELAVMPRPAGAQPSGAQPAAGQEAAGPAKGIVEKPNTQLASSLFAMTRSGRTFRVFLPFSDFDFLSRAFAGMNPLAQAEGLFNIDPAISEMRLTKDAEEIAVLREAIDLTAEALNEAYRAAQPGLSEVDLAAILRYTFDRRETEDSFLQAASGPNSTNVHFGATSRPLAAGDLVVFDVGCWIRGYTSDISRTVPASGRFTKEQRDIYALVLEAEKEGCRRLVPGVTFKAVQDQVEDILMAGLEKLGLVTDIKSPWQRRLYIQHGFGHGIGLDIHDVWGWHSPRLDEVAMAPGMVMTMEPGLYFPEARFEMVLGTFKGKIPDTEIAAFREKAGPVYKKYVGMGVRIEDDVLITTGGNEILSGRVPKEIPEIEKLMREKSPFNLTK
ncbi:MAG TPA: aminopeptidase P N-terminal domain-containing protein [Acidobacteriota bacterium]|nr:aminopeptidase P N-terminal domain-containing protein [Acidobacteriota bacterium]